MRDDDRDVHGQLEVLQDQLDVERCRQWWADEHAPVFGGSPIGNEAPDDEDDSADSPLFFQGLYGLIPGSQTGPIPMAPRRRSA